MGKMQLRYKGIDIRVSMWNGLNSYLEPHCSTLLLLGESWSGDLVEIQPALQEVKGSIPPSP